MAEIEIMADKAEWITALKRYGISDVYFQYEYVKPMADHLNAKPILINYKASDGGFIYCLLIMDIAADSKFKGLIPSGVYFDSETPYGYGGPCFYGNMSFGQSETEECRTAIYDALKSYGVISQFIRFYPMMFMDGKSTIITDKFGTYKNTVYIDLSSEEIVLSNMDSKYRREIKKAREVGVVIEHDKGEQIEEFIRLYDMTMKKHDAEDMYFFGRDYYDTLMQDFPDNFEVFYARMDGKVVGASIFLYDKDYMHFHLSGRDIDAPNISFEKLLMLEAALWGVKNGMKKLHMGGGLSNEDSLFQYKKKFNRSGILPFYIGRSIIDKVKYGELMEIRAKSDDSFDPENGFYIPYRF
ncbi:MAG: GNAT family N-acetyltransferase [Lachnoclostridium sp.]|nr:GNAT family N-acetyltransferase [Lachnospira sp.]MCM1247307.1 GNAT family N-acetyltransferase [Lachnoclostridium sp.]